MEEENFKVIPRKSREKRLSRKREWSKSQIYLKGQERQPEGQMCSCISVIPALWRLRPQEFEASLGYTERLHLKKKKKGKIA
jgi:hypothetical protein